MVAYLIENPPHSRQFRERRGKYTGCTVVHTAENTPDWVSHDTGAEGVARFIQGRSDPGCYHWLVDSDSIIHMVPLHLACYGDGTGSNEFAVHVSAATQAAKWNQAPKEWREETVRNMAAASARTARWAKKEHGIIIPAKRITKAESDAGKPGFIAHAQRDPARRSDPGADFPWDMFFHEYKEILNPPQPTPRINAVFEAESEEERRRALRRVMRRSNDEAAAAAELWLKGFRLDDQATKMRIKGREVLLDLRVKE